MTLVILHMKHLELPGESMAAGKQAPHQDKLQIWRKIYIFTVHLRPTSM